MKEYSIKTGKMEDVPETITNTNTVTLNPTTYILFLEQKIQSLKDELSAQEKTYEGAFENQRKNINGWKRRFKKEERKNIKQESQIKELENKISRLMDPHVIKPSELIKAIQEIKELREGICPKCNSPMFDKFSSMIHDVKNCGKPKPATAPNFENA